MTRLRACAVLVLSAAVACSGRAGESGSYFRLVTDADGIEAAENGLLPVEWEGGLPVLMLEETVQIGREDGPEYRLISSRWLAVDVALDGSVGYLERNPTELRVYEPDGRLRFRAGRAGDGPGEWRFGYVLEHVPGLGWAVSGLRSRFILWGEEGDLIDTIGLQDLPSRILNRMAVGADGRLWFFASQPLTWGEQTASLLRADWRTLAADTVLTAIEHKQDRVKDYGLLYSFPQSLALGPHGRVWSNTSLSFVIEVIGDSVQERLRVRREYEPVPDPLHGRELEDPEQYSMMQEYRRIYAGHHEFLPAIRSLWWVDGEELWVFTSIEPDTGSVQVDVFDPEGRYVRAFSAPADLATARAGSAAGHIWWLRTDEEETPVLVRYRYRLAPPSTVSPRR